MSFGYATQARNVDRMLRQYGTTGTLRAVAATYDPTTGATAETAESQTVRMVVFDFEQRFIDGSLIRAGDKQALVSAVGITAPKAGDSLTCGGVVYQVIASKPLAPALLAVLYELQIRV